jgi:hypothetical protein
MGRLLSQLPNSVFHYPLLVPADSGAGTNPVRAMDGRPMSEKSIKRLAY